MKINVGYFKNLNNAIYSFGGTSDSDNCMELDVPDEYLTEPKHPFLPDVTQYRFEIRGKGTKKDPYIVYRKTDEEIKQEPQYVVYMKKQREEQYKPRTDSKVIKAVRELLANPEIKKLLSFETQNLLSEVETEVTKIKTEITY